MRIAFVFSQDLNKPSGVLEKYKAQVEIWHEHGHEVHLFVIGVPAQGQGPFKSGVLHLVPRPQDQNRKIQSILSYYRMMGNLADRVRAEKPDVVYMRDMAFAPGLVNIMRGAPTVVELNTVNSREFRATASRIWRLYNQFTEPITLGFSSGIISVTNEIADTVARYQRPSCVIPNGFDLAQVNLRVTPDSSRSMIFVGTPGYPWHGIDKILYLAQCLPTWEFEVVGYSREQLPILDELPNLHAHGLLAPQDYRGLLDKASIALGTLALHRIGMNESCSLKVREYLAHGIPTILGNCDSDFTAQPWFLKVLPNNESNVQDNIDVILQFAESTHGKRIARSEIRHLDHRVKEPIRLDFLASRS